MHSIPLTPRHLKAMLPLIAAGEKFLVETTYGSSCRIRGVAELPEKSPSHYVVISLRRNDGEAALLLRPCSDLLLDEHLARRLETLHTRQIEQLVERTAPEWSAEVGRRLTGSQVANAFAAIETIQPGQLYQLTGEGELVTAGAAR